MRLAKRGRDLVRDRVLLDVQDGPDGVRVVVRGTGDLRAEARKQSQNSPTITYFTKSVSPLSHFPKSP